MGRSETGARIIVGIIAGLLLLGAATNLIASFFFGLGSVLFSVANAILTGWLGIGLLRRKDGAWIALLLFLTLSAMVQLAIALSTADVMIGAMAGLNVVLVALLIWAGRQFPEEGAQATPSPLIV